MGDTPPVDHQGKTVLPSFGEATMVWLKIGLLSFGGPAGQIAMMHRILVDERRWIGEQRFLHALNYCMLLPGPEAQQLAIYIGWLLHRTAGGLVAGILFVLPGAVVMLGLSIIYVLYRNVPVIDALFFGIKAAVLAIVIEAVIRIGKRALKNNAMLAVAAAAFIGIYVFSVPFPLIILAAGLVGLLGNSLAPALFAPRQNRGGSEEAQGTVDVMFGQGKLDHTRPTAMRTIRTAVIWLMIWLGPVLLLRAATDSGVWTEIANFFSLMAVSTFGGAYAVLAYVAQAAVENYGWLSPGEMVDGLGMAETTPGPLILVLQFVGFLAAYRAAGFDAPLVAGVLGSLLTSWVTFAPCFLWIFLGAPYIEKLRTNEALSAALTAITAAVVGVILNLSLWFALHVLFREVNQIGFGLDVPVLSSVDWRALFLAAIAMVAMFVFRFGMLSTIGLSALIGVLLTMIGYQG